MKWLIGFAAGVVLLGWHSTFAYTYLPTYKLPSLEFTVSCGNPELSTAAEQWASVSDLNFNGCSTHPTVELLVIDPWPHPDYGGICLRVDASHRRIEVRPEYEHDQAVMTHELGHCIGLYHSVTGGVRVVGDPGPAGAIMHWNPCNKVPGSPGPNVGPCNTMNADDIAGIQALYSVATPTLTPTLAPTATPTPFVPTSTASPTLTPTATRTIISLPTGTPPPVSTPTVAITPTQPPLQWKVFVPAISR
jgi:hypothetical protein